MLSQKSKSQKRTYNDLECFYSKLTKFLLKCHPKFANMTASNAKTTNAYLRLDKKS